MCNQGAIHYREAAMTVPPVLAPPIGCPQRDRLIGEIVGVQKRIAEIHDQEMVAVLKGDLEQFQPAELKHTRDLRDSLMEELLAHIAEHGC